MLLIKSFKRDNIVTVFIEKKPHISGHVPFKPTLFKVHGTQKHTVLNIWLLRTSSLKCCVTSFRLKKT